MIPCEKSNSNLYILDAVTPLQEYKQIETNLSGIPTTPVSPQTFEVQPNFVVSQLTDNIVSINYEKSCAQPTSREPVLSNAVENINTSVDRHQANENDTEDVAEMIDNTDKNKFDSNNSVMPVQVDIHTTTPKAASYAFMFNDQLTKSPVSIIYLLLPPHPFKKSVAKLSMII